MSYPLKYFAKRGRIYIMQYMRHVVRSMGKKKKRSGRLRVDIIIIVSVMILLITFFSYMLNTSLEDVLAEQRGEGVVITHTSSADK